MSTISPASDWDEHYQTGHLPWDTGAVESELVSIVKSLPAPPRRVVDVGCGTGTNAIYLAQQGAKVTGTDLSPKAIEMANAKARAANVAGVEFIACDILGDLRVPPASADFVFDRGCFHCMPAESRVTFAQRVHAMLAPAGRCIVVSEALLQKPCRSGTPQLVLGGSYFASACASAAGAIASAQASDTRIDENFTAFLLIAFDAAPKLDVEVSACQPVERPALTLLNSPRPPSHDNGQPG